MKLYLFLFVALFSCNTIVAQNTFKATVKDVGDTAIVTGDTVPVFLENSTVELEEVVITSTRSTRTIENIPTRIEFIGVEELDEKTMMKPGDIRMILSESTGIQTQQTSPISANASIRIQGLDGRYTQILKDGLPLYSGAASGLGLLQIPPLDLKQVEIIKGSSSTLYGGGAIAGLVNLISKTPTDKRELNFLLNGTSALGLDMSGFYSQKFKKIGLTLFASRNSNERPYDPAGIGLSAIPKFERYTLNPRIFVYFNNKTKADFGINTTFENRLGGDMLYLKGKGDREHNYFERNKTKRISTQFSLKHQFSDQSKMNIRNSYSHFGRIITTPESIFDGIQNSTFSEINYSYSGENTEWITGLNLWTDNFKEKQANENIALRDYNQLTSGVFIQNLSKITDCFSIESGLRGDYVADYGFAFLPRLSGLFKINRKWTSRLGGGLGYKTPTIFTEESERIQYRNVLQINSDKNKLERSYGVNADVNYRTVIADQIIFSINQLFFYTRLTHPLMLVPLDNEIYQFQNISGYTNTKGTETNLKVGYDDFKLFLGYSFTDAVVNGDNNRYQNPLTPKHRINAVLMYEVEEKWRAGLEAYYNSKQSLNDGTTGQAYWVFGAMVERIWEHFSLYVNFENFTDTRQTRFGSIYSGTVTNPVFKDIYAPLDGFVVNAGIKF